MPTTRHVFAALDLSDLRTVQGGCGKKKQCCPCPPPPAPAPAPAAAPPPSTDLVQTNVQISGYGQ